MTNLIGAFDGALAALFMLMTWMLARGPRRQPRLARIEARRKIQRS